MLAYIYDRLKTRLSGYFARLLSQSGKEVLLKAVAMAMPVFAMSCFKLTKKSCENLTKAMADFWWNSLEHKRKIHWLSWSKLCLAKELGGLAFKDIQCFNQALLAKQAWRIVDQPDSLFARVFKSRYFDQGDFLQATMGARPSYGWRSIQFGKELLVRGLRKQVGNGKSISVWVDAWIIDESVRRPLMKNISVDLRLTVSKLIDVPNRRWNLTVLEELFYQEDIDSIVKMKPVLDQEDYWTWVHNKSGCYSVKSGYWMINRLTNRVLIQEAETQPSLNGLKEAVWKIKTSPKIKSFMWKALSNAIPVGELLVKRGIRLDPCCQFCGFQGESVNHILFSCSVARHTWAYSNIPLPKDGFSDHSFYANFHYLLSLKSVKFIPDVIKRTFPWVLWFLWKNRNGFLFEGKDFQVPDMSVKIWEEAEMWFLAQELSVGIEQAGRDEGRNVKRNWLPPPSSWYKCNVAVAWNQRKQRGGASWVLRDEEGSVLIHSRRSFIGVHCLQDLKLKGFLWTVESMIYHKVNRVLFAMDDAQSFGVITRPRAWPYFKFQRSEMLRRLSRIEWWRVFQEVSVTNRGAFLIAQSALKERWIQSYVVFGGPFWLKEFFENEKVLPCV